MKFTTALRAFLALLLAFFGLAASPVSAETENLRQCEQICSYERLGIRSYVEPCMHGCTMFQNSYQESGDKSSTLAVCKSGCSSDARQLCEYGCNAAKRIFP